MCIFLSRKFIEAVFYKTCMGGLQVCFSGKSIYILVFIFVQLWRKLYVEFDSIHLYRVGSLLLDTTPALQVQKVIF